MHYKNTELQFDNQAEREVYDSWLFFIETINKLDDFDDVWNNFWAETDVYAKPEDDDFEVCLLKQIKASDISYNEFKMVEEKLYEEDLEDVLQWLKDEEIFTDDVVIRIDKDSFYSAFQTAFEEQLKN